jgi:transcription elongation factor GreA
MVESTERTSTSSESAAASDATGSAGASADGAGPAASRPVGAEHAANRGRAAAIVRARWETMVREDKRARMVAHKAIVDKSLRIFTIPQTTFSWYLCHTSYYRRLGCPSQADSYFAWSTMIREMREKLSREIDQLSHELNILLPQAIAQAVELGDLRENSEYKSALERQQFVQARLGQLHQRLNQLSQLANTEAPTDRVGLGSRVTVLDLETNDTDTYMVVLAEMMDFDAGHVSLASPLGRALANGRVGDEVSLRLPTAARRLRILDLVTVHQTEGTGISGPA